MAVNQETGVYSPSMHRSRAFAGLLACALTALAQSETDRVLETHLRELAANPRNSLASFRLGEYFVKQNNFQSAANQFRSALNGNRLPEWVVVWSHINLAEIFVKTGQRERAVLQYQAAVQTNDNTGGAVDRAVQFLKENGEIVPEKSLSSSAPPSLVVPPGTYVAGGNVRPPSIVEKVAPEYSDEARLAELEGTVILMGVITAQGQVREMQVTRPLGLGLDEKAIEAVRKWRFHPGTHQGENVDVFATVPVDFVMPAKTSRWHLVRATMRPPEGASRPSLRQASYPPGVGVAKTSLDHAGVVVAVGRQATATVSFDVDEKGRPTGFQVVAASEPLWGPEAIAIARTWEFAPGMKDGKPVSVPCVFSFAWGQRKMDAYVLRTLSERIPQ